MRTFHIFVSVPDNGKALVNIQHQDGRSIVFTEDDLDALIDQLCHSEWYIEQQRKAQQQAEPAQPNPAQRLSVVADQYSDDELWHPDPWQVSKYGA